MEQLKTLKNPPRKTPVSSVINSKYAGPASLIFGSIRTFPLDTDRGLLRQQFIKIDMNVTTGTTPKCISPFGTAIFRFMRLLFKGNEIETITPAMLESRIALLNETPSKTAIESGLLISFDVSTTKNYTIVIPVLWYFVLLGSYLTSAHKGFELELGVNYSLTDMGVLDDSNVTLNSMSIEILNKYDQLTPEEQTKAVQFPVSGINVYEEPVITVLSGSTSVRLQLTCPYHVFDTHFILRGVSGYIDYEITDLYFEGPNGYSNNISQKTNYTLTKDRYEDYTTSFTASFGDQYAGWQSNEYITFEGPMGATYVTVYFSALPENANLTVCHEYHSRIDAIGGMVTSTGWVEGFDKQFTDF